MRAAVLRSFGQPLDLADLPVPEPGPRDVVIRVEACGLCHTDLSSALGEEPCRPALPVVPGHEIVGRIAALGSEVHRFHRGQRVALGWLAWACGRCPACLTGREMLCAQRKHTGFDTDGGFAEFARAGADFVVEVPDGLDPLDAACLTCAGAAAYRAVRVAQASISDTVAIFGVGGVGHFAVQYARATGASVVAVDTVEDKLSMARELGARRALNASIEDPSAVINRSGGAACAIVTTSAPAALDQALGSLRRGGRLVLVGLPASAALRLPVARAVHDGMQVLGSPGPSRLDLTEAFALHRAGRTRAVHQVRSLSQVNEALAELEEDKVPARLVFELR